jgi:hypothetical protein
MENYVIILVILGVSGLGMAYMALITKKIRVSYSVLYVILGFALYSLISSLPHADPRVEESITLRLTELDVIVSLMDTGLKIDEKFSFRKWAVPLRLASITMLLSIALTTLLGYYWLGFSLSTAVMLGACLAPTDPCAGVGRAGGSANSGKRFGVSDIQASQENQIEYTRRRLYSPIRNAFRLWHHGAGIWLRIHRSLRMCGYAEKFGNRTRI